MIKTLKRSQLRSPHLLHFSTITLPSTYPFKDLEAKWQRSWLSGQFPFEINPFSPDLESKQKFYCLSQFPYPSGNLHMGHARVYYISDTIARFEKMRGKNVFHPMGWDAFGLPAENAAIERKIDPKDWTHDNIEQMRVQMEKLGVVFHWDYEVFTHRSDYYRWTQHIFLELFHNDFAYKAAAEVNWDPVDQTVLANEQIDDQGRSWRSGAIAEKKLLSQWFVKTTRLAEDLNNDLDKLEQWPAMVKEMQKGWIGLKHGVEVKFIVLSKENKKTLGELNIFTTRVETIYGVTFLGVAEEYDFNELKCGIGDIERIISYKKNNADNKEKQGLLLETVVAIHPLTGKELPIYLCNYIMKDVGTGAIMGVPAHDERDHAFSVKFKDIPVIQVLNESKDGEVTLINSEGFSEKHVDFALPLLKSHLKTLNAGKETTTLHLKDWLVSRQRKWGAPIPIVYCSECGIKPIPFEELPVQHCDANQISKCPQCKKPAIKEKDTLDTFFDSSWYYLRFLDPHNKKQMFSPNIVAKWMPVDVYIGGMEHAILHLLYARFMHKFLYQIKAFEKPFEPFKQLITQGLVKGVTYKQRTTGKYLKQDELSKYSKDEVEVSNEKMSKSKGNGRNPLEVIENYGADCLRLTLFFYGPTKNDIVWDDNLQKTLSGFLNKVWTHSMKLLTALEKEEKSSDLDFKGDSITTLKKFIELYESAIYSLQRSERDLHVAIARLMEIFNLISSYQEKEPQKTQNHLVFTKLFILLSYPLTPHLSSELWQYFKKYESFLEKKSKNQEIHKVILTELSFLKTFYLVGDLIQTKLFVKNKFRTVLNIKKEQFSDDEAFLDYLKRGDFLKSLKIKEEELGNYKIIRQKGKGIDSFSIINLIQKN